MYNIKWHHGVNKMDLMMESAQYRCRVPVCYRGGRGGGMHRSFRIAETAGQDGEVTLLPYCPNTPAHIAHTHMYYTKETGHQQPRRH